MTTSKYTYSINPSILQQMVPFLCDQNFTHFITLCMNDFQTVDVVRNRVRELHGRLDRGLLGSKWYKKPSDERTFFIGFHEHIDSNHHIHLLMRVKPQHEERMFQIIIPEWLHLTPKGTVKIKPIDRLDTCSGYCLKEQYKLQNYESFIVSTEFISH